MPPLENIKKTINRQGILDSSDSYRVNSVVKDPLTTQIGTAGKESLLTKTCFAALIKETEDGWFYGQIEEVPEVMSQGKSIDELMENLSDALSLVLQLRREKTRERFKGQTYITRKVDLA